jgi:hypothetical protein
MSSQEFWINKGGLVPRPDEIAGQPLSDKQLLALCGFVRVVRDENGTEVSWYCNAPNFASLYFAKEWIGTFPGPYRLNYFLSGWFTEEHDDPVIARNRIDQLIAKSDTLLTSRVYVKIVPHRRGCRSSVSRIHGLRASRSPALAKNPPSRSSGECRQCHSHA